MNLRLKTYLLLIPPTLLLGGLYLLSLLLFNRRDAYDSSLAQIKDRASIVEAFIEAENPHTFAALQDYLDTNLSESRERLLKNSADFEILVRDSASKQILYSWKQNPRSAEEHPVSLPWKHNYSEIRPLALSAFDSPIELVFVSQHPFHVFLDRKFWVDVALILFLLIILGGLLSEIIVRIIRRGLSGVDINAAILSDFPNLKSGQKGNRIQELDELSNTISTLFDSYEAKRSEKETLLSDPQTILESSDLLQEIRKHSEATDSITLSGCDCTLWKNDPDSRSHVSFLFRHESQIFAFLGSPKVASQGFDAGIIESIVMDTTKQSPRFSEGGNLGDRLESLGLFRTWTLLEIDPGKGLVKEYHSGNPTSVATETTIGANSRLMIPLGFELSTPIPKVITDSVHWKALIRRLFNNHPGSAVLCVESRMG